MNLSQGSCPFNALPEYDRAPNFRNFAFCHIFIGVFICAPARFTVILLEGIFNVCCTVCLSLKISKTAKFAIMETFPSPYQSDRQYEQIFEFVYLCLFYKRTVVFAPNVNRPCSESSCRSQFLIVIRTHEARVLTTQTATSRKKSNQQLQRQQFVDCP